MLKGISRQSPGGDARLPITLSLLGSIADVARVSIFPPYQQFLFIAMCSTVFFYAFLRCGEMCGSPHTLQLHNLYLDSNLQFATITFTSFKHSSPKKSFSVKTEAKPAAKICPVQHLYQYLSMRGPKPGPLFAYIDGSPVPRGHFTAKLNQCIKILNLPLASYKTHSFRIGAATHALMAGKSESQIQVMGRWASTSAFKSYVRVASIVTL